jgi:hypothetical protein
LDAPAETFARKAAFDCGMNVAPDDVEHVDAERHWAPSDVLGGHRLRRKGGDRRVERLNYESAHVGVNASLIARRATANAASSSPE